jgi:hypothetical protein
MVMSLQEAALRTLLKNPEDLEKALSEFSIEDSQEESSDNHPIASAAHKVLREIYPGFPLDANVDSVTQFLTTHKKIQKMNRPWNRPVNWKQSLASVYVEIRFKQLLDDLKLEIGCIRGGIRVLEEEFAAFFDSSAFRSPEAWKQFVQQAIQRLDLEQLVLEENERIPGIQRLLFLSSANNYWEGVQDLVDQEISLNFQDISGQTALHYAAGNNSLESMRILIERGAALNIRDNEGQTPLYYAVISDHKDAVETLITESVDLKIQDDSGRSPLHSAVRHNSLEILPILIAAGVDLNIRDHRGWAALHYAAQDPKLEILSILIAAGASLNIPDGQGETPLSLAEKSGSQKAVEILTNAVHFSKEPGKP